MKLVSVELKGFDVGYGTYVVLRRDTAVGPRVPTNEEALIGRTRLDSVLIDKVGVEEKVGVGVVVEFDNGVESDDVTAVFDGPSPGMFTGKHADGSGVDADHNCVPQDVVVCRKAAFMSRSTSIPISLSAVMPVFEAPALWLHAPSLSISSPPLH